MYTITQVQTQYVNYILRDGEANTCCTITPEKGGMLTSFQKDGVEYIYINEENYYSDTRTRCAAPILFPTTGLCANDTLCINNIDYPMGIHGIAHSQPWIVVDSETKDDARITLRLMANTQTLASYPYHFTYELTYILRGNTLTYDIKIINNDAIEMPFTFGFHPYFKVSDVRNLTIDAQAEEVQNMNDPRTPFEQVDFPYGDETKLTLYKARESAGFLDRETGRKVSVEFPSDFSYIILWSLCKQNFLCVEPWNALPNAMNEGIHETIPPHQSYTTQFSIRIG